MLRGLGRPVLSAASRPPTAFLVNRATTTTAAQIIVGRRWFGAASAPLVVKEASSGVGWTKIDYPLVSKIKYDTAPRTVMSPYAGGPVYQYLRNGWHQVKRRLKHLYRAEAENMDPLQSVFVGVPEQELNPNKNAWPTGLDPHAWAGPMDKIWEDFHYLVIFPFVVGGMFAYFFDRWLRVDPFAMFWKWHDPEATTWASWFPHKSFFMF